MCLTCHRAHASAFNNIGRWNFDSELLEEGYPSDQNLVDMGAVANADYYGRDVGIDFGLYQRSLCNNCHVKDRCGSVDDSMITPEGGLSRCGACGLAQRRRIDRSPQSARKPTRIATAGEWSAGTRPCAVRKAKLLGSAKLELGSVS